MRRYLHCDKGYFEADDLRSGVWINVECPDNADFDFLTHTLGIPEDFLTYTADPDERPRIEQDGCWTLTILRIPVRSPGQSVPYSTVPIGIITNDDVIVTICYHVTEVLDEFVAHSRRKSISRPTRPDFILHLLYAGCYWFLNYLKLINDSVTAGEKALERSVRNKDLLQMMQLGKSLVYFNTSLRGDEMLIDRIRHAYSDSADPDLLEDVEIELHQALNTVNIYTDILNASTDTFASIISNNVNNVMKRMTATTIVLMIPTGIASLYGMNVDISLSRYPGAFWIIVGIAGLLTATAYMILRRLRWF